MEDAKKINIFGCAWLLVALLGAVILVGLVASSEDGDPFNCRDFSACPSGKNIKVIDFNTYENCTGEVAARRAGMLCKDGTFPYYQGGYPYMRSKPDIPGYGKVGWDYEEENYECLERGNGTDVHCATWSADEKGYDESETGMFQVLRNT